MLFIVLHDVDWFITRKIKLEPEQYRPQDEMTAAAISEHEQVSALTSHPQERNRLHDVDSDPDYPHLNMQQ